MIIPIHVTRRVHRSSSFIEARQLRLPMPRIPSLNPYRPNNNRITAVDSATHIHSKVISALDALDINDSGESDIEVLGPCPRASAANLRPKRKVNTFNTRHVGRRELCVDFSFRPFVLSSPNNIVCTPCFYQSLQ